MYAEKGLKTSVQAGATSQWYSAFLVLESVPSTTKRNSRWSNKYLYLDNGGRWSDSIHNKQNVEATQAYGDGVEKQSVAYTGPLSTIKEMECQYPVTVRLPLLKILE